MSRSDDEGFVPQCPVALGPATTVQLAHGGGGRSSRQLLEQLILPSLGAPALAQSHDSALLLPEAGRLAFTSDGYVVQPRRFPGGDIGSLAVCGTINDLAMAGGQPRWLSVGLILEEGLELAELRAVLGSMRTAAEACGVALCTGDTKVVDRGHADGLYIHTSGIAHVPAGVDIHPGRIRPGDAVIVSGDVGRHGIAVLSVREGLAFELPITSDCGPLHEHVAALLAADVAVHCLRDATRGGVATVLAELARDTGIGIELDETAIPIDEAVAAACEVLGLDPLYVACEGRMVAFVPEAEAERALERLREHPGSEHAARIGTVIDDGSGMVTAKTAFGSRRVLDLLTGEQLPRIC